ncbi:MAG: ABC-type transport system, permease component [Phormidesmis priestleyi Ana]|uniref:ABC-type transport system, permease component n=1 Tax=Phormidesmis priestleyi Ana TaxID=1666911 RepID=A0A0P7YTB3_9CYAN|nr:MAG: ABC-type transport system, permease component [Phormidesmis priestleyi Ana]
MSLKFSDELTMLLKKERDSPLTLANVLAETSERSFCLVIILLVFPFLFPMLPGMTTPLGSACLLLSLQMAGGRHTPWLPARIAQFQFSEKFITWLLNHLRQVIKIVEKVAKPRWSRFTQRKIVWRMNGLCITWLALLLMSPVPLTNPLPTLGILTLAIATVEMDGLLMLLGYGLVGFNTALFGSIGYLLWRSPDLLQQLF